MGKTALDAPRKNVFMLPPESLTLITDPKHRLYDVRVNLPLDAGMVASIKAFGVKEAVLAFKDGENAVVLAGLQRVKNAIEANRQLVEDKCEPVLVPVMLERGDEATLYGIKLIENECRQDDDAVAKAHKMAHYLDMGRTIQQAAVVFGLKVAAAQQVLSLMDVAPKVQTAVTEQRLSVSAAAKLSKLPREEQVKALDELEPAVKPGKKATVKQTAKVVKKAQGDQSPDAPSKKEIKRLIDSGWIAGDMLEALQWVLTGTEGVNVKAALDKLRGEKAPEGSLVQ